MHEKQQECETNFKCAVGFWTDSSQFLQFYLYNFAFPRVKVLQSASEEYRCLDTFRGSHNNTLYIFCHNPVSPSLQCKELWNVALHTDVKFR